MECVPIYQLLLEDDFNLHDKDVQIGLLKIEYLDGWGLSVSACAKLLKLLPNLKSLGLCQNLAEMILLQ